MPVGSISSSPDTVGVAVVNYRAPILETLEQGLKRGYPGLDLVIFPEYSTQGFHPTLWHTLTTTLDGPEVAIFKQACIDNGVYGIFSLTGEEHPEGRNMYNTLIMITDQGEINHVYRKIFPWVPKEPWTAGHETSVAVGPKGLIVGGCICYDMNFPEIARDITFKGAELMVRIQGYMYPSKQQQVEVAKVRTCAWENNCYVAVANMAGRDLVYSYFGHSNVVSFDGTTLAECGTTPDEATYAKLSLSAIRNARRNWRRRTTYKAHAAMLEYNLAHRGYTAEGLGGHAACPFDFYKTWAAAPEKTRALSEALTRDADSPADATCADIAPMPPSRLVQASLGEKTANGVANGHANGTANGHANGVH
ncbi:hypothetical protein ABPG75_012112 [Micractinium tetrahymenae]